MSSLLSLRLNDRFFSSPPTNFHSGGKPSIKILMFLHDVDDSFAIIQVLLVKNNQMNITDLPQIPHCNQGKKNGDGHTHSFLLSPEFLVVRGEVEEVVAYSFDVRSQKWPAVHSICVCVRKTLLLLLLLREKSLEASE